jgi:protein involved in polysaccharide export with SLBB domain
LQIQKNRKSILTEMYRGSSSFLIRSVVFSLLVFSTFIAYSQVPPGTNPTVPGIPPTIPPFTIPAIPNTGKTGQPGDDMNKDAFKNDKINKDSLIEDGLKNSISGPKATYGANTFLNSPVFSITELSTPPLDYPIGVGDHIIVSAYEGAEFQKDYLVGTDGAIFPREMGKIYVAGYTFQNAQRLIYSRFAAVVPPSTKIDISLGQPRSINVNVVNEVNNPGIVTINAFSNAFNVIAKAGGVTENGNLRNIQIKRYGKVIEEIDVYEYLTSGYSGKRIYLQNNDFIIVPFYEKKVLATGQFKRPMYYQLKKNEGVRALLKYSGGLTADAIASNLKVITSINETQQQRDVNVTAILNNTMQDAPLKDGDVVKANLIRPGLTNKIEIRGEIKYPDVYQLRSGDRLFDIINRAGGVTKNTLLQRAYVFRGAGDSTNLQSADKLEVDLSEINNNDLSSSNNVLLMANDIILLFNVAEFSDPSYVEIFGEVRKEAKYNKYGGMTLQDLLYLSGGIKQSAEFGRLEISSIVDIDSAKKGLRPTRTIVKKFAILPNLQIDSTAAKIILKPYDQVFVRKNPTFELQQNIELRGLVKYPGLYPRLDKYEKLSSFIERAGGFKDNANLAGAILMRRKTENFRERVVQKPVFDSVGNRIGTTSQNNLDEPVTIDLNKALKNKDSKYDIILQDNDVIFIPEINPFVSIQGTVQAPLKISFDKEHTNVGYYVDKAGGFGIKPWRSRIFVTYANGKSKRTKNFLFFHFYPKVEEGCVVNIPKRPEGQEVIDIVKQTSISLVPVFITALLLKYLN